MDKSLMYLSILQTGLLYLSGFSTAEYVATRSDMWGFVAIATTIFLFMSNKFETYRRIEALLGPVSLNEPKETKGSKEKSAGTVGFALSTAK